MWILLRSPKMNWAIFGFQKRVWCPKWTPASSICRMDTPAMNSLLGVGPPRSPGDDPVEAPNQLEALQSTHPPVCRCLEVARRQVARVVIK